MSLFPCVDFFCFFLWLGKTFVCRLTFRWGLNQYKTRYRFIKLFRLAQSPPLPIPYLTSPYYTIPYHTPIVSLYLFASLSAFAGILFNVGLITTSPRDLKEFIPRATVQFSRDAKLTNTITIKIKIWLLLPISIKSPPHLFTLPPRWK